MTGGAGVIGSGATMGINLAANNGVDQVFMTFNGQNNGNQNLNNLLPDPGGPDDRQAPRPAAHHHLHPR